LRSFSCYHCYSSTNHSSRHNSPRQGHHEHESNKSAHRQDSNTPSSLGDPDDELEFSDLELSDPELSELEFSDSDLSDPTEPAQTQDHTQSDEGVKSDKEEDEAIQKYYVQLGRNSVGVGGANIAEHNPLSHRYDDFSMVEMERDGSIPEYPVVSTQLVDRLEDMYAHQLVPAIPLIMRETGIGHRRSVTFGYDQVFIFSRDNQEEYNATENYQNQSQNEGWFQYSGQNMGQYQDLGQHDGLSQYLGPESGQYQQLSKENTQYLEENSDSYLDLGQRKDKIKDLGQDIDPSKDQSVGQESSNQFIDQPHSHSSDSYLDDDSQQRNSDDSLVISGSDTNIVGFIVNSPIPDADGSQQSEYSENDVLEQETAIVEDTVSDPTETDEDDNDNYQTTEGDDDDDDDYTTDYTEDEDAENKEVEQESDDKERYSLKFIDQPSRERRSSYPKQNSPDSFDDSSIRSHLRGAQENKARHLGWGLYPNTDKNQHNNESGNGAREPRSRLRDECADKNNNKRNYRTTTPSQTNSGHRSPRIVINKNETKKLSRKVSQEVLHHVTVEERAVTAGRGRGNCVTTSDEPNKVRLLTHRRTFVNTVRDYFTTTTTEEVAVGKAEASEIRGFGRYHSSEEEETEKCGRGERKTVGSEQGKTAMDKLHRDDQGETDVENRKGLEEIMNSNTNAYECKRFSRGKVDETMDELGGSQNINKMQDSNPVKVGLNDANNLLGCEQGIPKQKCTKMAIDELKTIWEYGNSKIARDKENAWNMKWKKPGDELQLSPHHPNIVNIWNTYSTINNRREMYDTQNTNMNNEPARFMELDENRDKNNSNIIIIDNASHELTQHLSDIDIAETQKTEKGRASIPKRSIKTNKNNDYESIVKVPIERSEDGGQYGRHVKQNKTMSVYQPFYTISDTVHSGIFSRKSGNQTSHFKHIKSISKTNDPCLEYDFESTISAAGKEKQKGKIKSLVGRMGDNVNFIDSSDTGYSYRDSYRGQGFKSAMSKRSPTTMRRNVTVFKRHSGKTDSHKSVGWTGKRKARQRHNFASGKNSPSGPRPELQYSTLNSVREKFLRDAVNIHDTNGPESMGSERFTPTFAGSKETYRDIDANILSPRLDKFKFLFDSTSDTSPSDSSPTATQTDQSLFRVNRDSTARANSKTLKNANQTVRRKVVSPELFQKVDDIRRYHLNIVNNSGCGDLPATMLDPDPDPTHSVVGFESCRRRLSYHITSVTDYQKSSLSSHNHKVDSSQVKQTTTSVYNPVAESIIQQVGGLITQPAAEHEVREIVQQFNTQKFQFNDERAYEKLKSRLRRYDNSSLLTNEQVPMNGELPFSLSRRISPTRDIKTSNVPQGNGPTVQPLKKIEKQSNHSTVYDIVKKTSDYTLKMIEIDKQYESRQPENVPVDNRNSSASIALLSLEVMQEAYPATTVQAVQQVYSPIIGNSGTMKIQKISVTGIKSIHERVSWRGDDKKIVKNHLSNEPEVQRLKTKNRQSSGDQILLQSNNQIPNQATEPLIKQRTKQDSSIQAQRWSSVIQVSGPVIQPVNSSEVRHIQPDVEQMHINQIRGHSVHDSRDKTVVNMQSAYEPVVQSLSSQRSQNEDFIQAKRKSSVQQNIEKSNQIKSTSVQNEITPESIIQATRLSSIQRTNDPPVPAPRKSEIKNDHAKIVESTNGQQNSKQVFRGSQDKTLGSGQSGNGSLVQQINEEKSNNTAHVVESLNITRMSTQVIGKSKDKIIENRQSSNGPVIQKMEGVKPNEYTAEIESVNIKKISKQEIWDSQDISQHFANKSVVQQSMEERPDKWSTKQIFQPTSSEILNRGSSALTQQGFESEEYVLSTRLTPALLPFNDSTMQQSGRSDTQNVYMPSKSSKDQQLQEQIFEKSEDKTFVNRSSTRGLPAQRLTGEYMQSTSGQIQSRMSEANQGSLQLEQTRVKPNSFGSDTKQSSVPTISPVPVNVLFEQHRVKSSSLNQGTKQLSVHESPPIPVQEKGSTIEVSRGSKVQTVDRPDTEQLRRTNQTNDKKHLVQLDQQVKDRVSVRNQSGNGTIQHSNTGVPITQQITNQLIEQTNRLCKTIRKEGLSNVCNIKSCDVRHLAKSRDFEHKSSKWQAGEIASNEGCLVTCGALCDAKQECKTHNHSSASRSSPLDIHAETISHDTARNSVSNSPVLNAKNHIPGKRATVGSIGGNGIQSSGESFFRQKGEAIQPTKNPMSRSTTIERERRDSSISRYEGNPKDSVPSETNGLPAGVSFTQIQRIGNGWRNVGQHNVENDSMKKAAGRSNDSFSTSIPHNQKRFEISSFYLPTLPNILYLIYTNDNQKVKYNFFLFLQNYSQNKIQIMHQKLNYD